MADGGHFVFIVVYTLSGSSILVNFWYVANLTLIYQKMPKNLLLQFFWGECSEYYYIDPTKPWIFKISISKLERVPHFYKSLISRLGTGSRSTAIMAIYNQLSWCLLLIDFSLSYSKTQLILKRKKTCTVGPNKYKCGIWYYYTCTSVLFFDNAYFQLYF